MCVCRSAPAPVRSHPRSVGLEPAKMTTRLHSRLHPAQRASIILDGQNPSAQNGLSTGQSPNLHQVTRFDLGRAACELNLGNEHELVLRTFGAGVVGPR